MTGAAMGHGPFELVVFDFDGTLCDSADVKTGAFYDLYLDDYGPRFAAAVREYHLANAGISRYDKIQYVERIFVGTEPDEHRVEQVALRFSQLVEQAVVAAPLFDDVLELLTSRPTGTRYAIASATPTDELKRITVRKGISEFFQAIEGSPRSKAEILSEYVSQFEVESRNVVMVGDQPSDADGARSAGTGGLMIAPPPAPWTAPFERVDDFKAAREWLNKRMPDRS